MLPVNAAILLWYRDTSYYGHNKRLDFKVARSLLAEHGARIQEPSRRRDGNSPQRISEAATPRYFRNRNRYRVSGSSASMGIPMPISKTNANKAIYQGFSKEVPLILVKTLHLFRNNHTIKSITIHYVKVLLGAGSGTSVALVCSWMWFVNSKF